MINFKQLSIPDVLLIEPQIFNDERGFFFESYNQREFEKAINRKVTFVQDNHSKSSKGVLRGLHYQLDPYTQGKLVRVISGEVFDVAVDVRKNSISYGHWVGEFLSAHNKKQLWIPEGFAHGFLVLSESVEFLYKTTNFYSKKDEISIDPFDSDLRIDWLLDKSKIIQSEKDKNGLSLKEALSLIH